MKIVLSWFLITNFCMASEVRVVRKGEIVPFDGVLFTKNKEQEIRSDLQVAEKKVITLRKLNEINESENKILTERLKLYQESTKELANRESSQESSNLTKNILFFVSGAVLTGLIGYGVIRSYR